MSRDCLTALENVADAAKVPDQRLSVVADRRLASTVPVMYLPLPSEPAAGNSDKDGCGAPGGRRGMGRMGQMGGTGGTASMRGM